MATDFKKSFTLSYPELIMHANTVHVFATRDVAEFTDYGVDQAAIDAYETQIDEFEVLPTDEELLTDQMNATNAKNAGREELEQILRSFSTRGKLTFGYGTPNWRKLNIEAMTRISDGEFLTASRRVARMAERFLADLAAYGMTQPIIDDLSAKNQTFENLFDDFIEATGARDTATETRVLKGNELYDKMMDMCNIGKTIWFGVSEAKYNDYLTYSMPPGVPGKIQNLAYDLTAGAASWDQEPTATTYQLQFAPELPGEPIWITEYEGPGTTYTIDPGGPDNYMFRCRGRNENGYGYWSDVLIVERP